jgi:predicted amidohydrolase
MSPRDATPSELLRLAALQWDVRRGELDANLARVRSGLEQAAERGVDLVCLPELWPTSFEAAGGPFADPTLARAALAAADRARDAVAELSERFGLAVAGTLLAEDEAGGAPRNRLELWAEGRQLMRYDKLHLFSPTGEALGFTAGDEPPPLVTWRGVRWSCVICYDLRFGPLCDFVRAAGAEVVLVPAQWPTPRASHWRALLCGRAVELQACLVGANRLGSESLGRERAPLRFPGNSLIVGPDGGVVAEGRGEPGLVVGEVDLARVRAMRRQVPVARDRRDELYGSWIRRPSDESPGPSEAFGRL